jgi:hypothetical protein
MHKNTPRKRYFITPLLPFSGTMRKGFVRKFIQMFQGMIKIKYRTAERVMVGNPFFVSRPRHR